MRCLFIFWNRFKFKG